MNIENWKENRFDGSDLDRLLEYLDIISAGHSDPLSAYLPYIENGPLDLLQVLKKFLGFNEYNNDYRYVRLWLLYASQQENPEEIYNQLLQRNIGKYCSVLYVALADLYENFYCFELSELAYLRGIVNKASPFDKLFKCYEDFRSRTQKKKSVDQNISVEEKRSILHLRSYIETKNEVPNKSPYTTPVTHKYYSRINDSAIKKTPDLENMYHSPGDSKIIIHSPTLVNGRRPLSLI